MSSNNYTPGVHDNSGVGQYSNLQKNQIFRDRDNYGSKGTYENKNPYESKNPYASNNPYESKNPYATSEKEKFIPKFKRFNDLKILNEKMMHMSNNTLSDDSRIEIVTQGELGEIKNLLAGRILKVPLAPLFSSLAFGLVIMFTDNIFITLISLFIYLGILVRTFFYPARLYYENIKYKTTRAAKMYYEEMDYWYKIYVVKVYVYLIIASIAIFVASFYQDEIIAFFTTHFLKNNGVMQSGLMHEYIKTISFSVSLKFLAVLNIIILIAYSKFANNQKLQAEIMLKDKMKKIRNEKISRVQKIQADKN